MAAGRLTKTAVEAASAAERDSYLWDSALPGFGLKVTPRGTRIYLVQYRPRHGRATRRYTLGKHGAPWTTEQAREAAQKLLARVRLGGDPFAEEQIARRMQIAQAAAQVEEEQRAQAELFPVVVAEFIKRYAAPKNRSWPEARRILTSVDLAPWENRRISQISRREVMSLVDRVQARAAGAGRLLFAHLRRFFSWCVERLYLDISPMAGLRGPPLPKARDRVLSDREIALFWRATEQISHPFGPLLRLLLLTGQRKNEVTAMSWVELDLDAAQWTIPGERTKNGQAHAVDLSASAVGILRRMQHQGDRDYNRLSNGNHSKTSRRYVFTTTGSTPVSGHSKAKMALDALMHDSGGLPVTPWRIHDLRRTAATGMAQLGSAPHVVEAVLNHRSGSRGGLVAVYQHYDHRSERRAALLAWDKHVSVITRSSNE